MYKKLYDMLNGIKLYKKTQKPFQARLGFPEHYSAVFGMIKPRYGKEVGLSLYSRKHPEIYEELLRIGAIVCPFPFTTIQVNRNCCCPPHKDKGNRGMSCLVSFGEYTGGLIVIEGVEHNAYENPICFDGAKMTHWNTEHDGNKYSLVFFS
jgi:hypothetical protein